MKLLIYIHFFLFLYCTNVFPLDKGSEIVVNYKKYGRFMNIGTTNYQYVIKDLEGLKKAVGPGIFPNMDAVKADPDYIEAEIKGELSEPLWDYIYRIKNPLLNFFRWSTATVDFGVRLFYCGIAMENAGMYVQAIKCYYALVVHFPRALSNSYWNTPLYLGKMAMDRLYLLTKNHPELGIKYDCGKIVIQYIYDDKASNDNYVSIDPGKLMQVEPEEVNPPVIDLNQLDSVETRGGSYVSIKKFANGHWVLYLKDKPFFIQGISYSPNEVGKSPDYGTLNPGKDWQIIDLNDNSINDVFFESYVDKNRNDNRDDDEPITGDAQLLKDMGVNTLRIYHHIYNKELFRKLYKEYGFFVILGDFFGVYAIGSGATWHEGTDYTDPVQQENMLESVQKMVQDYKEEPYVLMWMLGNENNYGTACNTREYPEEYYQLVNQAAELIHKLDPTRPVVLCNGDALFLHYFTEYCKEVDVYGANCYRGSLGFGPSLWRDIKDMADKPVIITEYGCPAYANNMNDDEIEAGQKEYHKGNWQDIWNNRAGSGFGNSLGGVIFQWCDEWWKAGAGTDAAYHDSHAQFGAPFLDGWSYEEWFGICSQGDGSDSPFLRQLRQVYYYYQEVWNKKKF